MEHRWKHSLLQCRRGRGVIISVSHGTPKPSSKNFVVPKRWLAQLSQLDHSKFALFLLTSDIAHSLPIPEVISCPSP